MDNDTKPTILLLVAQVSVPGCFTSLTQNPFGFLVFLLASLSL